MRKNFLWVGTILMSLASSPHVGPVSYRKAPTPYDVVLSIQSSTIGLCTRCLPLLSDLAIRSLRVATHIFMSLLIILPLYLDFCCADETATMQFFLRHGCPARLLSDKGSNYTSVLGSELLRLLKIHPVTSSGWHPQTNGQKEQATGSCSHCFVFFCLSRALIGI